MRLFIGATVPEAVTEAVDADATTLRDSVDALKWVALTSLHTTLKFLGERPETDVDAFRAALSSVAARHQLFDVVTTDVGAFPNFRRPRVVGLGRTGETAFRALARDVDAALAELGIERERRQFQAH